MLILQLGFYFSVACKHERETRCEQRAEEALMLLGLNVRPLGFIHFVNTMESTRTLTYIFRHPAG